MRQAIKRALITVGVGLMLLAPLTVITGVAYSLTLPKMYRSHTLSQVVFPITAYQNYDPVLLKNLTLSSAETVTCAPILYGTIDALDLQCKWGGKRKPLPKEIARKRLASSVHVSLYRDSLDLISINVTQTDPNEASQIANTLTRLYKTAIELNPAQTNPTSIVILEGARPSIGPVSPNLTLNVLLSLALGGSFFIIGALFFLLGLRQKRYIPTSRRPGV